MLPKPVISPGMIAAPNLRPVIVGGYTQSPFRQVLAGGIGQVKFGPPPVVAPVLADPGGTSSGSVLLEWTAASGFPFDEYRVYAGATEFGVYTLLDTVPDSQLDYSAFIGIDTWFYIAPYDSGTTTESNESNRVFVTYNPPAIEYTYLRPGGVDSYFRPDGTSTYIRP